VNQSGEPSRPRAESRRRELVCGAEAERGGFPYRQWAGADVLGEMMRSHGRGSRPVGGGCVGRWRWRDEAKPGMLGGGRWAGGISERNIPAKVVGSIHCAPGRNVSVLGWDRCDRYPG
jgi:hypothetical protein